MLAGSAAGKGSGSSRRVNEGSVESRSIEPSSGNGRSIDSRFPDCDREQPPQLSVSPAVFQKFQKLIYSETGIWLSNTKKALLCGRLFRRLRELGITSLETYYERVAGPDRHEECARMIDAITTNETRFFREPRQFEFLVEKLVPRWQAEAEHRSRSKKLRVWSAGCSSGEEPYTLAMLLTRHLIERQTENRSEGQNEAQNWDVRILATDISNRVLEKARKGIYPIARSAELPLDLLHRFMLRGMGERLGEVKVKNEIQGMVEFRRWNLDQQSDLPEGPFDVIFCRNVLIYFDQPAKRRVVANLVRHLRPNGLLFVGHAESLNSVSGELRSLEPSIYTQREN